jgi:hypothetical protein
MTFSARLMLWMSVLLASVSSNSPTSFFAMEGSLLD